MDAAVAKIRDAFICQLSPNVTPNDRAAAFQIIQQFKSERSQDQIRIIFQLIEDDNPNVRHAILGIFYDFIRIEWNQLPSPDKDSTKRSIIGLYKTCTTPNDARQVSRIVGEIAIREWPQMWPAFTDLICQGDRSQHIHIIRTCAEMQFKVNHQLIENTTRHRELSVALVNLHSRLIDIVITICHDQTYPIVIKNEVLSHAALIIESSTQEILLQLINAPDLWSLLATSTSVIGRSDSIICVTLFELFIVTVSRQAVNSNERVELWKIFSSDPQRLQIIGKVLHLALECTTELEFHLVTRVAQFAEYYGSLIASCWYSSKNCEHDAIRNLSQCQMDIKWLLDLLQIRSNPFVVESAVHALNFILKAIDADRAVHKGDEDRAKLKQQLFQAAKLLVSRLVDVFSYFDSESFHNQDISRFHQAFESQPHQKTFCNKLINSGCSVLKQLTKLIPREMSMMLAELTISNLPNTQEGVRRRIIVAFCCSCNPIIATHFASNDSTRFLDTNLPHAFQLLLEFTTTNQDDLKFKIEMLRGHLDLLKLLPPKLIYSTVECLLNICESIDGEDSSSARLRRQSASALVNLTNVNAEVMEPLFELIHTTAAKWQSSRLHIGPRVLLFEVLVMLCWLPCRRNLLPSLLSDLLTAVSSLLSQTKPDLDSIETVDQFAEVIGFKCNDIGEILAENSIYTHNRSSLTSAVALLLVILRRCEIGSGSSADSNTREALSVGAACLLKVLKIFQFFQQIYSIQISETARLALDTEATDLAQINQTDDAVMNETSKKDGSVRLRSLIENMQQQIQLALQCGAKVWPELYSMPQLYEMLSVSQLQHLPASRQRLVIRQLLSPFVQYCPVNQIEIASQIVNDLIISCITQLSTWWQRIEDGDFETEQDELLHYFRTQTLTKDFIEFLFTTVKSNNEVSHCAKNMIQTRIKVLLYGICTPLNWLCAKSMQKCCTILLTLLPLLENEQNFTTDIRSDCLITILKAFSIHGEHLECIAPLTQLGFNIYKSRYDTFHKILEQIPHVDLNLVSNFNRILTENKLSEKKLRLKFKEICQPLLKKPVSEEGKLEFKIASLPPLFNRRNRKWNRFDDTSNDSEFDVNWIALENF